VLVVEPSRTLRKIVGLTLAADGLAFTEAADGLEAIERVREDGRPAVLVAAAGLPGIDGYELCKLVRQHPETAAIPVVLLTDGAGLREKLRAKRAGADAVLPKPLRPADLRAAVAEFRKP
jgi:CheY-like chemotaxis protein